MPAGGMLTFRVENQQVGAGSDSSRGVPAGDYVRACVTDTGTGMPPEIVPRACEPFFTTKSVGKGTGLGLSQVSGFAKRSGGFVTIESVVGTRTRVFLLLPRAA